MKKNVMQDIADELNISKNSVSRALSGKSGISDSTRQLVVNKAIEMGYNYNENKAKDDNIKHYALIASSFALSKKEFFGHIYLSIETKLKQSNVNLYVHSIDDFSLNSLDIPKTISSHSVDGIIIMSHLTDDYINQVLSYKIPTVVVDYHSPNVDCDCVVAKNKDGAYTAVDYLIQHNHRSIGFIGGIDFSPSYEERWDGYLRALRKNNIKLDNNFAITKIIEKKDDVFEKLNSLKKHPTSWFCANSGYGFLLSLYYNSNGYKIPDDISIICFDNTDFTKLASPPMSCVYTDFSTFGNAAIDLLNYRINHPGEPYIDISLPVNMIERTSVANVKPNSH